MEEIGSADECFDINDRASETSYGSGNSAQDPDRVRIESQVKYSSLSSENSEDLWLFLCFAVIRFIYAYLYLFGQRRSFAVLLFNMAYQAYNVKKYLTLLLPPVFGGKSSNIHGANKDNMYVSRIFRENWSVSMIIHLFCSHHQRAMCLYDYARFGLLCFLSSDDNDSCCCDMLSPEERLNKSEQVPVLLHTASNYSTLPKIIF